MRLVVQRVTSAQVEVAADVVGAIDRPGLLILAGVTHEDQPVTAERLAEKVWTLRILRGERSCQEENAPILVVSQFTLYADTRRGRRPGFTDAASPDLARALWLRVADGIRAQGVEVGLGQFGAEMAVELVNDGPFTIWLDTADRSG
jgi:D-aminoacyl-tRNA deacylase